MSPVFRVRGLLLATAIILPTLAAAQTPFDMSPERGDEPVIGQPSGGDTFVMPFDTLPDAGPDDTATQPAPAILPEAPEPPAAPVQPAMPAAPSEPAPAPKPEERYAGDIDRFIQAWLKTQVGNGA